MTLMVRGEDCKVSGAMSLLELRDTHIPMWTQIRTELILKELQSLILSFLASQ